MSTNTVDDTRLERTFYRARQSPIPSADTRDKVVAIIDLGSNSARMLIVRILSGGSFTVLNKVKHMVRLGENAFQEKRLQEPAIQRTLLVLRSFVSMCQNYGVEEILPVATAAVRDAENAEEFLTQVYEKTALELQVISGMEEARLICLGVSGGLPLNLGLRFFIDIGGGSTEIAIANAMGHQLLDSLKLGCVRMTNRFLTTKTDQVPSSTFAEMCQAIRTVAVPLLNRVRDLKTIEMIASSGTALALHNVAYRLQHSAPPPSNHTSLSLDGLRRAAKHLCTLTAEERRMLPNVSSRRAEVLVAGAAILLTLMEEFKFAQLSVSTRNLQDGILRDYLQRTQESNEALSIREQSVLQLARRCLFEEQHAYHMAKLTLQMHDSFVDCGLMSLDHQARELLYYAALLHDIGIFTAYSKHASHGAYLIRHSELLGFTQEEIRFLATLTEHHNIKPSKKYDDLLHAQDPDQVRLRNFTLFLSLAENMDRLHCQYVHEVQFARNDKELVLHVRSKSASPIELDAITNMTKILKKALDSDVVIRITSLT